MRRKNLSKSGPNFFGLLVFIVIIVLGFFGATKALPLIQYTSFNKADRFNIAISGNKTQLLSLSPLKKTAIILDFPPDLYMTQVAFGYGKYPISSVYGAGQLDRRGGETLTRTLAEYVGVPMNGYVYLGEGQGGLKKTIISKSFLTSPSNLSILEKLQVMLLVFNLRDDKVKTIDLAKLATPLVLADGSTAISLEKEELDNSLSGVFLEDSLRDEDFRIEVVNTTKVLGLGTRVSRLLSNIGLMVVNVDSSNLFLPACKIEANKKAMGSRTVSRISSIYGCQIGKMDEDENRAAVRLFVGTDYANQVAP